MKHIVHPQMPHFICSAYDLSSHPPSPCLVTICSNDSLRPLHVMSFHHDTADSRGYTSLFMTHRGQIRGRASAKLLKTEESLTCGSICGQNTSPLAKIHSDFLFVS